MSSEPSDQSFRIRELNDAFRRSFLGGRVLVTRGVAALGEATRAALLAEVRAFDSFGPDNDPYGEHDFGSIEHAGERFFWKIDLYEEKEVKGSGRPPVEVRVLTIMLASEY